MEQDSNHEKPTTDSEHETKLLLPHHHHDLPSSRTRKTKGGLRTMPFIIVNEAFEKVASYGLMPNMIFYLMDFYHMEAAGGTVVLSIWGALSNSLAIFGAFFADSYLGRFWVISLGSFSSLLGMIFLWLTAMLPQLRPAPCDSNCNPPTPAQLVLLYASFGLMSIGAGCVRPCSIAFGADQLKDEQNPNNERVLDSFFNWYYGSIGISTVLALTVIVYIQDHLGWQIGFAVPAILMLCSVLMFLLGSSLYVRVKANESLFSGFIQAAVVAFKNRNLSLPPVNYDDCYLHINGTGRVELTENLRFLNKACLIRDPERDLKPDGSASNPWNLCTVENVESLKSLLRVIPLWSSGILLFTTISGTFATLQAKTMDRHVTSGFEIPAGSFTLFMVITITIWVAFYDRILVPFLAKYTNQPRGLSPYARMGIGLLLGAAAMVLSAIVEIIRRDRAIKEGLAHDPNATVHMSAMWLVPQFILLGLAEAFNAIGQIEFFYSQFPKSMSSIAVAFSTLAMAVSGLVGSLLVSVVDAASQAGGKVSWLATNINEGHIDYYYWLMAFLNLLNYLYFLFCCRLYRNSPSKERGVEESDSRHYS